MIALVVEDSPIKGRAVLDLLSTVPSIDAVLMERSYQGALRQIQAAVPDIIILDMTLPNFDVEPGIRTGKPRPMGGYDILRKLHRKSIKTAVIILTQYESFDHGAKTLLLSELDQKCRNEFPLIYRDAIYFSPTNMKWADELIEALRVLGGEDG